MNFDYITSLGTMRNKQSNAMAAAWIIDGSGGISIAVQRWLWKLILSDMWSHKLMHTIYFNDQGETFVSGC